MTTSKKVNFRASYFFPTRLMKRLLSRKSSRSAGASTSSTPSATPVSTPRPNEKEPEPQPPPPTPREVITEEEPAPPPTAAAPPPAGPPLAAPPAPAATSSLISIDEIAIASSPARHVGPALLPPESGALDLGTLRAVQAALTSHPWLLALPELQPFREFLVDTSSRCESGEVDRDMRAVRAEVGGDERRLRERAAGCIPRNAASPLPYAPAAAEGEDSSRPPTPPPRLIRSYSQWVDLTSGPCILLRAASLSSEAAKGGAIKDGVYVLMWMVDRLDRCVGGVASWPLKEGTAIPLWNSARQLTSGSHAPSSGLRIELWHATKELLIGASKVPVEALTPERPLTLPLRKPDEDDQIAVVAASVAATSASAANGGGGAHTTPRSGVSTITIQPVPRPNGQKQVFFIRHGESRWNEAQRRKDVLEMVSHVDHPLSDTGFEQARHLQEAIRHAVVASMTETASSSAAAAAGHESPTPLSTSKPEDAALRSLASATAVWTSPLTRAIQTCIVGLQPLLAARKLPVELRSNAREKKNFGGRDTIGQSIGEQCGKRAISGLKEMGASPAELRSLEELSFVTDEVEQPWWVASVESKEQVKLRIEELIHQIHYSPHDTIIVVGHSHFFRAMFQRFLHSEVQRRSPDLARILCEDVLPNCGVASCQFDFTRGPRMITDVCPLLSSPSPLSGSYRLVIQRQSEQLTGPVIHLGAIRGVPNRPGIGRPHVRMYLTDSSGMHAGRFALWPPATPHAETLDGQRPSLLSSAARDAALSSAPVVGCVWNSARQLGRSHWDSDTVLHVEVLGEGKSGELLAVGEVPLRCVGSEPLDLGAIATLPQPKRSFTKKSKEGEGNEGSTPPPSSKKEKLELPSLPLLAPPSTPPVALTLRRVPPDVSPVKHLFILVHAETTLGEAYRSVMRLRSNGKEEEGGVSTEHSNGSNHGPPPLSHESSAEQSAPSSPTLRETSGAELPQDATSHHHHFHSHAAGGAVSGLQGTLEELGERMTQLLEKGGDAIRRLKEVAKRTDHPLSRTGWIQAQGLRKLLINATRGGTASRAALKADDEDVRTLLRSQSTTGEVVVDGSSASSVEPNAVISLLLHSAVWASPLARCVQTALLALQPILSDGSLKLELKPNAREQRLLSNLHTSIGNSCGEKAIRKRCIEKMRNVVAAGGGVKEECDLVDELEKQPMEAYEVEAPWWSLNPEADKEYSARTNELLHQLQYCEHESVVLCAHNGTLQELLRNHLHEEARERHAELLAQLCPPPGPVPRFAPPCSLLWACVDYRRGARPICDLMLVTPSLGGDGEPSTPTRQKA